MATTGNRSVQGWKHQVKPERELLIFWHWMWLKEWQPNSGYIFDIIKHTQHQYHDYVVRRCKKNTINIQTQKLAEHISDSKQLKKKKKSQANKIVTTVTDSAIEDITITDV